MITLAKPLMSLTAGELMNTDVVALSETMSLRDAAQLLLGNQIGGAPVVNAAGQCVGVFSSIDLVRFTQAMARSLPAASPLPVTCSFQKKVEVSPGKEVTSCLLPPGVCPLQMKQPGPDGKEMNLCSHPNCVLVDWQMVELEKLPADEVGRYMTPDPVIAFATVPIRVLARMMIDAHIHRIIVVDDERRPIGVVSSTDLLAAMAYAEDE